MQRSRARVVICLPLAAMFVAACGTQYQSDRVDRRYEDLRGLVLEQRRAIDDIRKEQEALRTSVDELQYGRRPGGRPAYAPGGPGSAGGDSYWGSALQRPTPPVPTTGAETTDGLAGTPGSEDPRYGTAAPGAVASVPPPKSPAAAEAPPAPTPGAPGTVPTELTGTNFDSGMRALDSGDHDEAIQHFRNFLHDNASSPFADDAQFWIGESYFRKGQYHRAIIELNQVAITYGSGDRAPSALVRQAEAFRIVGDRVDAKLSLQKVINRYPGTGEAAKASKMLSEIGG